MKKLTLVLSLFVISFIVKAQKDSYDFKIVDNIWLEGELRDDSFKDSGWKNIEGDRYVKNKDTIYIGDHNDEYSSGNNRSYLWSPDCNSSLIDSSWELITSKKLGDSTIKVHLLDDTPYKGGDIGFINDISTDINPSLQFNSNDSSVSLFDTEGNLIYFKSKTAIDCPNFQYALEILIELEKKRMEFELKRSELKENKL